MFSIKMNNPHDPLKPLQDELSPEEIVRELDRYVIGQNDAKKAVAIALRNRSRRKRVPAEMQEEISPKNIMMIGNTGVGKTEIARRLANLVDAPFIKVEATKFTEIGYVGRDVESIIRDLLSAAIDKERAKSLKDVTERARNEANEEILNTLLPLPNTNPNRNEPENSFSVSLNVQSPNPATTGEVDRSASAGSSNDANNANREKPDNRTREKLAAKLAKGELDDKLIEIEIKSPTGGGGLGGIVGGGKGGEFPFIGFGNPADMGGENPGNMIKNILGSLGGGAKQKKKLPIKEAREVLERQIAETMIDMEKIQQAALHHTENMGIVFIDEIDKIVSKGNSDQIQVSRQGVQRDLLPLVEGCTVNTKYGMVHTHHILFIAAGAFHTATVSDIIPELQGRFPIRVELNPLTEKDFINILEEPRNSLIKQYQELLKTEGVILDFKKDAIKAIARICRQTNEKVADIGARRLSTIMEKLLADILYKDYQKKSKLSIDAKFVEQELGDIMKSEDLRRYIL